MKHYLTAILILAPQFAHGAADEPLTVKKLIGMACSSRGKLSCITLITPKPEPSCMITLAYSEHAALKKNALDNITQRLSEMDIQDNYESFIKFRTFCQEETAKQVAEELSYKQSSDATIVPSSSINFIAMCILLGIESYQFNGYYHHSSTTNADQISDSNSLWEAMPCNNQMCMHLVANRYLLLPSEEVVADPQLKADDLQTQKPKIPFHLIIKLDAWRSYVEPIKDERKNQIVLRSNNKEACSIQ